MLLTDRLGGGGVGANFQEVLRVQFFFYFLNTVVKHQ